MRLFFGVVLVLCGILPACQGTRRAQESNLLVTQSLYRDFCDLSGVSRVTGQTQLWSAETVQFQINELLRQPKIKNSVWSAYPVSYLKMTAARDEARCRGVLRSNDAFYARVNDLLSDLMTRFYVAEAGACAKSDATLISNGGICTLMARMRDERFDSLSAAMASTGLYISSHISLALIAIIYADDFWDASPYPETHQNQRAWDQILSARVMRLRTYKPLFDKFNGFLADNIATVAQALGDANLLNGDILRFVAGVSRYVPFKSMMFGRIRDEAFAIALDLAGKMNPAEHPMMIIRNGRNQINYSGPRMDFVYPAELLLLEQRGIEFAANRENMFLYRTVLGGRAWEEVISGSDTTP